MKIGDSVKVHLGGESPWATVIDLSPNRFKGKIDNVLFNDYDDQDKADFANQHGFVPEINHDLHYEDEVWFYTENGMWLVDHKMTA